jgi:hypothetical protein
MKQTVTILLVLIGAFWQAGDVLREITIREEQVQKIAELKAKIARLDQQLYDLEYQVYLLKLEKQRKAYPCMFGRCPPAR